MDMLHALISGFLQCFNLSTFNLMMIGIAIGFVVGILPGLGGPTAMALMLPFVFKMSAVEAFAFLLGMTAVTATTGDITSVLFGVPGEPTTATTGQATTRWDRSCRALAAQTRRIFLPLSVWSMAGRPTFGERAIWATRSSP